MKKVMVFILLAAIGAVGLIGRADAAPKMGGGMSNGSPGGRCLDPDCHGSIFRHRGFAGNDHDWQDNPIFPDQMSCRDVRWKIHDRGFRNILAVSCAGRIYIFSALRNGHPVRVYASGETGQIRKVVPGY